MAKDETSAGGLFAKVVRFVKNPATQWNDLDQDTSTDRQGSLSKQALKEMIERKRRNDFVRKREFDMLRKLRRREASGMSTAEAMARPSFFQSSMPSRPDDRAQTLKKIDEIEAQMSMQWWKTKHGQQASSSTMPPGSEFPASDMSNTGASGMNLAKTAQNNNLAYARTAPQNLEGLSFPRETPPNQAKSSGAGALRSTRTTEPMALRPLANAAYAPDSLDASLKKVSLQASSAPATSLVTPVPPVTSPFKPALAAATTATATPTATHTTALSSVPTQATPIQKPMPPSRAPSSGIKAPMMGSLAASYDSTGAATGFSASKLFALEVDEVQHDPELEEAAIRFANGDDAGAEAGLLEAIGPKGSRHQHEETWLALFDLYRATAGFDKFESTAIDFASKFGRSAPMWFSIPEIVGRMGGQENAAPSGSQKAHWRSPANFGIQSLAALNAALAKAPQPWVIDFSAIVQIEDNAVTGLVKLFHSWANQTVQLRFAHAIKLEEALRAVAVSGNKTVPHDRWNLLLQYLRISHRPDEFELAALDFCVTYELSPPPWESAQCELKVLDDEGNTKAGQTIIGDVIHDSMVSQLADAQGNSLSAAHLSSVELSGQIMGEPRPVLEKLEARLGAADVMIISCAKLIRVDFSAAGSLLNWVSARQSEGRLVQFSDVHRLVAAFFHVIGISEHAKVVTRID